jgi:hypothetical protein
MNVPGFSVTQYYVETRTNRMKILEKIGGAISYPVACGA